METEVSWHQERIFTPDGIAINYRSWYNPSWYREPQNEPKDYTPPLLLRHGLLLIHGLASSLRIWDKVAIELVKAGEYAIALDQPGHGESDKPDTGYTTKQIVDDDFELAEQLEMGGDQEHPLIVGHSWGATIALAYAATYPDKVVGLVLVDGGMGNMRDRPGGDDWERVARELAPPDFAGTPRETFLDFYRKNPYLAPVWDEQLEDMVLNIVQLREDDTVGPRLSRANHMQILRSMWETDNLALASKVRCPVLMISAETGATDERSATWAVSKREGAKKMLAALSNSPKAEFLIMPDTIHDIPLQRPKELVDAILKFFNQ